MTNMQKIIWAIVIVIILGGLYWWWSGSQGSTPPATQVTTTQDQSGNSTSGSGANAGTGVSVSGSVSAGTAAPTSAAVTFNGHAFSPANVTIAQGGTVTFTSTGGNMWVASDPHPIHNGYDGTTQEQHCAPGYAGAAPFDQCVPGTSFTFTFNKVGTWGYHDHLSASLGGTVTVVAQ